MMRPRIAFLRGALVALALLLPAAAACQTGSATVTVIDRSRLEVLVLPASFTGELGDTITFRGVTIDTISGDTIPALLEWRSSDPAGVEIDRETGHATLLQAGTYTVFADAVRVTSLLIMRLHDDGTLDEVFQREHAARYAATGVVPETLRLDVADVARLCAYLMAESDIVGRSSTACPSWAPGMPAPQQGLIPIDPALYLRFGARPG